MPTIPVAQRQVQTAPLPSVGVPVSAPQGAFGGVDIAPAASIFAQAREKAEADADEMVVNSKERELEDARIRILQDPKTGAINKRGVNALTAMADAQEDWQQTTSAIAATLTNDRQRQAFASREQGRYNQMVEQIAAHTSAELRRADIETTKSFLDDGIADIAASPELAPTAITDARTRLVEFAQRAGWSPETLKEKASAHVSDIHAAAISAFVERKTYDSAKQAAAYLKEHGAEVLMGDRKKAQELVDAGLIDGETLKETGTILEDVQQKQEQGKPLTLMQALDQAKSIEDPKVRKQVTANIRRHYQDIAADKRQQQNEAFQSAGAILEKTKDLSKIPVAQWMLLSPAERRGLKRDEDLMRHPNSAKNKKSDMDTYTSLLNASVLNEATRQDFAKIPLSKYRAQLSDADYKKMVWRQASILGENTRSKTAAAKKFTADSTANPWKAIYRHPAMPASVAAAAGVTTGNVDLTKDILTPKAKTTREPTQQMLDDVKKKGPKYADYLREHGYAIP